MSLLQRWSKQRAVAVSNKRRRPGTMGVPPSDLRVDGTGRGVVCDVKFYRARGRNVGGWILLSDYIEEFKARIRAQAVHGTNRGAT